MRLGLFIPCYVDQFYPDIGMATLELLERLPGVQVEFPEAQSCCGQPMANTGCLDDTRPIAEKFVEIFSEYDGVVCPSGSCVSMVRNHYASFFHQDARYDSMRKRVWELCEFLTDVVPLTELNQPFPHRVGLHASCHGLRELRLDHCSELGSASGEKPPGKVRRLLEMVPEIELIELERVDECCGFGGTFAVAEEGVSIMMGTDRVQDHQSAGAEVITATDASCLMHLEGILRRQKRPLVTMHIAEILAGRAIRDR